MEVFAKIINNWELIGLIITNIVTLFTQPIHKRKDK
jgi:hypothetical protein